ncbi:MAG: aldo/keto reductase [Rhodospirillales bacterium]|nr:aldo/keto reductase [Alphaproteobacteria bacterium]MCB9986536.1 aldo/keto reductase [Rhodospirillales bacterium]USO06928.1 MAG: aldo/keto reductase [Rhodospirillales bacterium]
MKKKILGSSGLEVTDICLGTMTWGNQNTQDEGHRQMDYALDRGINFFDTAEMYAVPPSAETYGKTEAIIGAWFAARKNRDKIILASKMVGPGFRWVRDAAPISAATVPLAIEGSLKRLQTDYIDVYQLHWPNRPFPHFVNHGAGKIDFTATTTAREEDNLLEILRALAEAVKAGKIRHMALSNDSAWGVMKYLWLAEKHGLPRMVSIQCEFGLLCRVDDPHLAEVCVRENVAYLPWSPLGGGALSGKYAGGARPAGARWTVDPRPPHRDTPDTHLAIAAYGAVAEKHGLDLCQMGIAFCRAQNFVTSTIIGATTMQQLETNIGAGEIELGPEVLKDIDAVYHSFPMPY